jgi:hypothetical protein
VEHAAAGRRSRADLLATTIDLMGSHGTKIK